MEKGVRYTAKEFIQEAGFDLSSVFSDGGNILLRVRIGGLPVRNPVQLIKASSETVDVVVGTEVATLKLDEYNPDSETISNEASKVVKANSGETTE